MTTYLITIGHPAKWAEDVEGYWHSFGSDCTTEHFAGSLADALERRTQMMTEIATKFPRGRAWYGLPSITGTTCKMLPDGRHVGRPAAPPITIHIQGVEALLPGCTAPEFRPDPYRGPGGMARFFADADAEKGRK